MLKIVLLLFIVVFNQVDACDFTDVTFSADFSSAHLDDCQQSGENSYLLTIKPENYPINDSPWYAFKVFAKDQRMIDIAIQYKQGRHRYRPKISHDGETWTIIPHQISNEKLTFKVVVTSQPVWISAQELVTNETYKNWLQLFAKKPEYQLSILGDSTEKRPIYQLESNADSKEWVVIVGRMHPPEVTGALALFPFSEELLLNNATGKSFRERFNILIIPNLNPDGVEHGHWRSNINGVDLNRDWKLFQQQETRVVRDKLQQIVADGGKIVFAIDFHSTGKDIFYTMPADYGLAPALLVETWLKHVDEITPQFKITMKPGHNPDNGVFKQYIADTYGVHAITYEMADRADRKQIISIAKIAAKSFMQVLLDTPKSHFYKNTYDVTANK